jgi:hypothetical protein
MSLLIARTARRVALVYNDPFLGEKDVWHGWFTADVIVYCVVFMQESSGQMEESRGTMPVS